MLSDNHAATAHGDGSSGDAMPGGGGGNLLVVEPEALFRWSLVTYLSKYFRVFAADSRAVGARVLEDHPLDALVLSDDLEDGGADDIEALARKRNSAVRVVRIVTTRARERSLQLGSMCIEKPFELSKLAGLLGVQDGMCC